ncbi:MAG: cysteine desulfurase [Chloroflexi bacterium]|nr:MAG: cysteine desulfurase [Chloroflexota bacterium]TME90483.1 MAG: cysteine desulfurase [Chloroflexota bacterium]
MAVTVKTGTEVRSPLDVAKIRADFPILSRAVNGKPVVYLDNAATSQKPRQVIGAMRAVFEEYNANIHRGVYEFSEQTTAAFEGARAKVARFIGAHDDREVIFVRNATEGVNLVAYTWGRENIRSGDRIISTVLEHHSDFVPWQQLAKDVGAQIVMIDVDDDGRLRREQLSAEIKKGAKLLAITHTSNGLGTVNPVKEIVAEARAAGATVLVDAAQAVPHTPVDVTDLDCDFLVFSGHKMLAPPGSGGVWGRIGLLERMRPFLFGGDMISRVTVEKTEWNELPWKFEAGTSSYVDAIGLGAAVDYLEAVGVANIHDHELSLVAYLLPRLSEIPGVEVYGPKTLDDRVGVVSFNIEGIHPHDVATIFDREGVCVRAGHHCNQLLMTRLGVAATTRASFYLYNTTDECDALLGAIDRAKKVFKV